MYGIIDTGPEVPLGKIKIQINNNHLTSMISRQIADFLKPNCYTSKTDVSLSILIPKIDGIFKIQWQFRISDEPQVHDSWFDILLGSDFYQMMQAQFTAPCMMKMSLPYYSRME